MNKSYEQIVAESTASHEKHKEESINGFVANMRWGADEIEAGRAFKPDRYGACEAVSDLRWAANQIEMLTAQRDEARRWVCYQKAASVTYCYPPEHFAKQHRWDCFDVMPNKRQKQMMALDDLARLDDELGLSNYDPPNEALKRVTEDYERHISQTGILRRTDSPETGNLERTDDNGQS
jgi:hypothetical protein